MGALSDLLELFWYSPSMKRKNCRMGAFAEELVWRKGTGKERACWKLLQSYFQSFFFSLSSSKLKWLIKLSGV